MTRRVLASVFFVAAGFVLLAKADGPTPPAKADDQPAAEGGKVSLNELRDKQVRMMADFKKAKDSLQLVANRLERSAKPEDKSNGARLKEVLNKQGGAIEVKFDDLNKLLK